MRWFFIATLIISTIILPAKSYSAGISLIRDAEIEDFLYDLTKPVFKVAGLDPNEIKIYIVNDNTLNAFVAGGQNVFINTGLIAKYTDPGVLIGVVAHETGHITAGHLARGSEEMQNAGRVMLLSYIAGIAAAVVNPNAGMAMIMGGSQIAGRSALKFTRTQEEAADYLALKYLKATGNSANGLVTLLELFNTEEAEYKNQIDEYALTHPVSKKRIDFIKAHSSNFSTQNHTELKKRLERIVAKLNGFLNDPDRILKFANQNNINDRYAMVVAYHKKGNSKEAIRILDGLIKLEPQNNYLYDLKGQILFESGDQKGAIAAYNQAIKLNKNNDLARVAMATAIINLNLNDKKLIDFAIENLLIAERKEKSDGNIYKQLSIAYNQKGDLGRSYLALAELNLLQENQRKALQYAKLARNNLSKNNKIELLRLDDIEQFAKKIKDVKAEDLNN
ncbi:MAG: family peptidase [Rickettsiaceae bacterium]|jgi:predicted Zn-dependent protease|nr:family peptidase [Rickettsiaceae bacterium]